MWHEGAVYGSKETLPRKFPNTLNPNPKLPERLALFQEALGRADPKAPAQTGFVDFLTLTVFFHVLMGAVDEAKSLWAPVFQAFRV